MSSAPVSPYHQQGSTMPSAAPAAHSSHHLVPFASMGGECPHAWPHNCLHGSMAPSPHSSTVKTPSVSKLAFYQPVCSAAPLDAEALADLKACRRPSRYCTVHTYFCTVRWYFLARPTKVRRKTCERARPPSQASEMSGYGRYDPRRDPMSVRSHVRSFPGGIIRKVTAIPEGILCPLNPMSVRSQQESYGRLRQS
jgi:hypothetical protein